MMLRPFRDLIIAIASLGLTWLAHGQTGQNNNKELVFAKNSAESAEYSDPGRFRVALSEALAELNSYEFAVVVELRRGADRLGKGCTSTSAPKSDAENALVSRNTLAFEQAASVVQGRRDRLQQSGPAYEQAANRQVAQYCTGLDVGLFKSNACKQAQDLLSAVKIYRSETDRYYKLQSERYRTYLDLVQIERQGCVRSGFSTRLLQANEAHMRDSEAQSERLQDRWNREFNRYLVGTGTQK